ncbi:hypothetical protein AOLI_G00136270 [Acnodon oligacanthus]
MGVHNMGVSQQWPSHFQIPEFAYDTALILESDNIAFKKNGTFLNNPSIKSDILEKLAEKIYQFCEYPTNQQICSVSEALVQKHPCFEGTRFILWVLQMGNQTKIQDGKLQIKIEKSRMPRACCELSHQ